MIKSEIRYSWVYNNVLNNKDFGAEEIYTLRKDGKEFEKIHAKYFDKIIELIERHTKGERWLYSFIPIYIIRNKIPVHSFADPLTLKYREDANKMLIVLIHELVHCRINFEKQMNVSEEERESMVNEITKKVCLERGISLKDSPIRGLSE